MNDQGHTENLSELLSRAQEIDQASGTILENRPDLVEIVSAAQEAGLSRDAILTALRERLIEEAIDHEVGDPVFAESPDGHWYPATFQKQTGNKIELRYLNGGQGNVEPSQVRSFNLAPGQKVQSYSSAYKMWIDAEIVRYNPDSRSVTVNAWYSEEVLPLERVRLKKDKKGLNISGRTRAIATTAIIAFTTAAATGIFGYIIGVITSR